MFYVYIHIKDIKNYPNLEFESSKFLNEGGGFS